MQSKFNAYMAKYTHQPRIAESKQIQVAQQYAQVDPDNENLNVQQHMLEDQMKLQHEKNYNRIHRLNQKRTTNRDRFRLRQLLRGEVIQARIIRQFQQYQEQKDRQNMPRQKDVPNVHRVRKHQRQQVQKGYSKTLLSEKTDMAYFKAQNYFKKAKENITSMMQSVRQRIGSSMEAVLVPKNVLEHFIHKMLRMRLMTMPEGRRIKLKYRQIVQSSMEFKDACKQWNRAYILDQEEEDDIRDLALQHGNRALIRLNAGREILLELLEVSRQRIKYPDNFDRHGNRINFSDEQQEIEQDSN